MANRMENKQINIRVSDEEFNRLYLMASDLGLSVSAFCKSKVKGIKTVKPKISNEIALQIHSELRHIGINLNQVAKHLNSGTSVSEGKIEAIVSR